MSYLDELNQRLYDTNAEKTGLRHERPWWFRAPAMLGGLTLIGVGSAITAGTLGGGAVVGGPLIAIGGSFVLGSVASDDKVKTRHATFDLAQEIDQEKRGEELQLLKGNSITGNLFPYLRTYIPFSGARATFLETEKLLDFAQRTPEVLVTNTDAKTVNPIIVPSRIPGVSDETVAAAKKICKLKVVGREGTKEARAETLKEERKEIKNQSSIPGTSPAATFCKSLCSLFGRNSSDVGRY